MKVIANGRGKGKTEELIKLSAENNVRILTLSYGESRDIMYKAKMLGLQIPEPISVDGDIDSLKGKDIQSLYIDDAECLLKSILASRYGITLKGITVSVNDEFNFKNTVDDIDVDETIQQVKEVAKEIIDSSKVVTKDLLQKGSKILDKISKKL